MPVGRQLCARAVRSRLLLAVAVAAVALPVVVLPAAPPASALQTPQVRVSGFSFGQPIATNNTNLTNFVYLPNGLILSLGKEGTVTLVNTSNGSITPVGVSFANQVNSDVDRGVVGIDLAPDYASSGTLYLLYDYNLGGCAPKETAQAVNNVCARLSRFTANNPAAPIVLVNDTLILDGLPAFSAYGVSNDQSHTVGTVIVASDGSLFVGNGD